MSTNILETETFSITRFFGGRYRGVCYQINVAGSPGYVQLTRDEAVLLRSALTDELFGDPSEATPSKENAPTFKCKARSGNMGANDPQECDWPVCGCDPYADKVIATLQESGVIMDSKARTVPVGTPQKETPPTAVIYCEFCHHHHRLGTCTWAAPAPEGVQGKEPQVWRPQVEPIRREMMKRFSDTLSMEEIASCAYAISTANYSEGAPPMKTFGEFWETVTDSEIEDGIEDVAKRAYLSGEAAGRRSAITEIQGRMAKHIDEHAEECGIGDEMSNFYQLVNIWCAELQEKTKP